MSAPKGNKFAAKAKECEQALKRAMAREFNGDWRKGLDEICGTVVELAMQGERWAAETVFDRLDGKPSQSLDITNDVTVRDARELSDGHLADIATGRSSGVADAESGTSEPTGIH